MCCSPAVTSVNTTDKHPRLSGLLFAVLEDCCISTFQDSMSTCAPHVNKTAALPRILLLLRAAVSSLVSDLDKMGRERRRWSSAGFPVLLNCFHEALIKVLSILLAPGSPSVTCVRYSSQDKNKCCAFLMLTHELNWVHSHRSRRGPANG